jgi:rSAM/selenodomain-associated transferase 2
VPRRVVKWRARPHSPCVPGDALLGISVVIPVLDERDGLVEALACTERPRVERIVVDGGSTDGSAEAARGVGAERVMSAPRRRARQLEAGYRAANGDAVLFLHADTRLDPGWDAALRGALADPRAAGGAFRLRFASERPVYRLIEAGVRLRARALGLPYGDQALFVRRKVLDAAGGVPDVPIFEDLDLTRIIRAAGRLVLLPVRARTSARRYRRRGVARTVLRNNLALAAWGLGLDRDRVAAWYRGGRRA